MLGKCPEILQKTAFRPVILPFIKVSKKFIVISKWSKYKSIPDCISANITRPVYKLLPENIWYFVLHSTKYHLIFELSLN